jgi:hypothetical protein
MRNRARSEPLALLFAVSLLLATNAAAQSENIDPAGDGHQYAWGENVGWLNAEPSGDGGNGAQVADFVLTGWLWGENIGWVSLSCTNTSVCGTSQYGVGNDGSGKLSGFAWSENAGWINFAPTTCAGDPTCGVRIDPATGYFSGRAWGENIGWITFSKGPPAEWTARTSWCQGLSGPPGVVTGLTLGKSGSEVVLTWTAPQGSGWYDVVEGALSALRSSGGNFAVATRRCTAGRVVGTSVTAAGTPPPGDAAWYLVRGANCRGRATYDDGSPSQPVGRDAGIAASQRGCP